MEIIPLQAKLNSTLQFRIF